MSTPLCRTFYSKKRKYNQVSTCSKNCPLFHPDAVSPEYDQEFNRELGFCYCGASLKTILNRRSIGKEDEPTFYMVCGKTFKSIKRCKK